MNRALLALALLAVPSFAQAAATTVKGKIVEAVRKDPKVKAQKLTKIYVRNTALGNRWSNFTITGVRSPGKAPAWQGGPAIAPGNYKITGSYDNLGGTVGKGGPLIIVSGVRVAKDGPQPLAMPRF